MEKACVSEFQYVSVIVLALRYVDDRETKGIRSLEVVYY